MLVMMAMSGRNVALADVAAETDVETRLLQQVVDERSRGGLAVGPRYAYLLGSVIASCELDFREDGSALLHQFLDHGGRGRDAGALHYLVCVEDELLAVLSLLEGDLPFPQGIGIMVRDLPLVREENVESFHFGKHCGSDSAFSSTQYYNPRHILRFLFYLTFSNASVAMARMISTNQKRATILASGRARTGFCISAGMPSFWKW